MGYSLWKNNGQVDRDISDFRDGTRQSSQTIRQTIKGKAEE